MEMTMDRKELVAQLDMLAPALASNELLPQLTKFWFDDKAEHRKDGKQGTITAYNDRIAIVVEREGLTFSGCLSGAMLLGLLKSSDAKEIGLRLTSDNNNIDITMSEGAKRKTAATIALSPIEQFFKYPAKMPAPVVVKGKDLLDGLKYCLKTTTDDTSIPDQLGVTLIQLTKEDMALCSTNNDCITRVIVEGDFSDKVGDRVVLSTEFCKQIVAIGDEKGVFSIAEAEATYVTSGAVVAGAAGLKLYGRLIEVEKPLDFTGQFKHHAPKAVIDTMIPVPPELRMAVERSLVLAASGDGEARITMSVDKSTLKLLTRATVGKALIGSVTDTVSGVKHPPVSAVLKPKALKMALDNGYDYMAITESVLVMSAENAFATMLIATTPAG
jgi:hypothetical protein